MEKQEILEKLQKQKGIENTLNKGKLPIIQYSEYFGICAHSKAILSNSFYTTSFYRS